MAETCFQTFLNAVENCTEREGILGKEALIFPPRREYYGYEATPRNALTFGAMGVDGVHYVILMIDGAVTDDSPVLHISPMDSDSQLLLSESFLSYLAEACSVSVSEMEALIARERAEGNVLIPFLKERFDASWIFVRPLGRYAGLLDLKQPPD